MKETAENGALLVGAPMNGWCESLDDSPDPVFRDRILGDGASIDPTDDVVLAPFDGEVLTVPESKHAINLRADNGAEFLIHVGIDTVQLAGEGFTAHVKAGDRVHKGQRLLSFDMDGVSRGAASLRTPVLLLHSDTYAVNGLQHAGPVRAGDTLFEVTSAGATKSAAGRPRASTGSCSETVIVGLAHGVHARPAARLIDSISRFDAILECRTDNDKTANAHSAVALMAMGVGHGDRLTVVATGADAEAALAEFVALLEPLDAVPAKATKPRSEARRIRPPAAGVAIRAQSASSGFAVGSAVQIRAWEAPSIASPRTPVEERASLQRAIGAVHDYLARLAASQTGTGREIAHVHLALLQDPTIAEGANARIRRGVSAAVAWQHSVMEVVQPLRQLDDRRMRQRGDDLEDINRRVQRALAGHKPGDALELPNDAVVIAHTLLPSQLLELDRRRVAAICTATGGTTSHVAILAASMDIPMLVAAGEAVLAIEDGSTLAVDADYGELHVQPDENRAAAFRNRARDDENRRRQEQAAALEECLTADGVRIHVNANIASVRDAEIAVQRGADGCGLLRTEFVFMDRADPPDASEQLLIYQHISDVLGDRPLVVRTLDAGGDKPIAYINPEIEENPALGIRGIRLSLRNKAMLETQLGALLQLRRSGFLQLMIPMVTSVHEVLEVRDTIDTLCQKQNFRSEFRLGVMIETPAAAVIADRLAEIVDFFSIGTNDLTQYTLAMDRGEPLLAARLDTLHPAVLNLIAKTADAAKEAGKPVAVCGGAAGDMLAAPILIGLGIRELSMVPGVIARQKAHVRKLEVSDCVRLARQSLTMSSARDVRAMMRDFTTGLPGD